MGKKQQTKRRTWGTGSVSPKGLGRWLLRTSHRSLDQADGSKKPIRRNRVVHAASRREAEKLLQDMLTAHRTAGVGKRERWTLDRWLRHVYSNAELAPRTRETALQAWDLYTSDAFKALLLDAVTVEDVDQELDRLRKLVSRYGRPLAPRTRALWYANLRRALNVAVHKRLIMTANPALLTDRAPSSDTSTERPRWTAVEAARFLTAAEEDRLSALWRLLLETGLRPGEAFALRWSDLKGTVLTVRRSLIRLRDDTVSFGPTKTHAVREAELSPALVAALKGHRARQNTERLKAGRHYHVKHDLIFATEIGEPLRHDVVTRQYKRLVQQAQVPALHLYGLRHTSASLKVEAGVDIKTVSEGLGHKDSAITLKHYVKSSPPQQRAATAALSALLANSAPSQGG